MEEENWSNIIRNESYISLSSIKEVWQYRDLLWMFVKRDIVTNYKQTVLGPIWFFIQPALTTAMFVFVQRAAKIETNGIHPVLFYLIGITAWNYFAECFVKTSTTFKDNAFIFGKVYFPRLILPLSIVFSSLIKFFIQMILFFITLIILLAITSLTTKYKDLAMLVQFGIQLLMYATLMIPISLTSGFFHKILAYNPMIPINETMRQSFFNTTPTNWLQIGYSFIVMMILVVVGFYIFTKTEKTFTDTI